MERSGPGDARDDAPDDGWDDDATVYPPAPIPAHERSWRHPSEIGHDAWITSEPPVTIGRGLLVTSGAIGSALGVAVLYLLLPAAGASPSASPEATSSIASLRSPVVQVADEPLDTGTLVTLSTAPAYDAPHFTLPAGDTPSTVLVMAVERSSQEPVSVAVAVEGAPYVITTANALASIGAIDLLGPGDGADTDRMPAELVSVEGELAYLAPSAHMEVVSFAATATAEPGQTVTVLADDPAEVAYPESGSTGGVPGLDAGRIVEGTPVIDEQGALVALCTVTIDADGAYVEMISVTGDDTGDDTDSESGTDTDGSGGGDTEPTPSDVTPESDPATPAPTPSGGSTPPTSSAAPTPSVVASSGGSTSAGPFGPITTASATTAPASNSVAPTSTNPGSADPTGNGASTGASSTPTTPDASSGPATPSTTTTTIARGSSTGTVAWAGLRFDGAPVSAPLTVTNVVTSSPALAAGVAAGDRIVAIDGVTVATLEELTAAIKGHAPGDVVKLTVVPRATGTTGNTGATRVISVVLAAYVPAV